MARSSLPQTIPAYRSFRSISLTGSAVKGAACMNTRSLNSASRRMSPPSSASTQVRVAGASARQPTERGPGATASKAVGTSSLSGRSATVRTTRPSKSVTVISVGNRSSGTA